MKGPMTYSEEQDALSMGYGHGFTDLLPKISYQDSQPKLKNEDPMLKMRLLMDQSIVQAAIDETIRASEKTQKRQHAEYEDDQEKSAAPPKPAKVAKKNAFSVMMTAKPKPAKWTNGIVSFEGMEVEFEQMLLGQHLDQHLNNGFLRRQHDGATSMALAITDWFKGRILPHLQRAPHMQTKINALHVLIEIAAGIAYAPESQISSYISRSIVPKFLLDEMYNLVNRMSTSEMKQLVEEGGFLSKVKGLRQTPVKKWEGDTWNGLDEILRVVKDHGPVDFRRIYSEVDLKIKDSYYSSASGVPIVKSIRNEILSYITRSMCFETKYNAMNALADIGILLMKRSVCYDDQKATFDTLFGALSIVGQMFNEEEVAQILTEMQSENFMSTPGFLSKFLSDMYGGYSDYIKVYSNREMLKSAVDRYMSQKTSVYGQRGLLVKILYLRFYETSRFEGANDILDEVIALFPDRSTPLQPQHILRQLDKEIFDYLQLASYGHWIPPEPGAARRIRKNIDRSISQVSKQASRGTRVEVKLSALKILTEIGLRMVEWCHSTHPQWHRTIFQDHLSEDSLTDSMLLICHSLNKSDWIKVMEDQSFLDDMRELDARRLEIPESMEGLDPILSIIRDPEHETSKSSRRTIAAAPVAIENIIDLTDD